MKLAVFSDIHGNYEALEAIYNDIKKQNVDEIICLGDIIGLGPQPVKCLDFIMNHPDITMVRGNHEEKQLFFTDEEIHKHGLEHQLWVRERLSKKHFEFMENLPLSIKREYKGKKVMFSHFFIKSEERGNQFYPFETIDDKEKLKKIKDKLDCDYIFVGHHHFFYEYKDLGIVDVSTSGCVYDNKTHYYIINIDDEITYEKKVITFDRESFEKSFEGFINIFDIPNRFFGVKMK